jgi:hypothetical protein
MNYKTADVSEQQLEDLIRTHAGMIEEGLVYVDHQRRTADGRLDVLMADSGGKENRKALVVAELKIDEDDGMLLQGLDYYDYVSSHVETYARLYKDKSIDPTKEVRLFLIAPSFSQTLINWCKWISAPISLFTFTCLKFDGQDEITPVFSEQTIPTPPPIIDVPTSAEHLDYITDDTVRGQAAGFLHEIENWKPGSVISKDPISFGISIKVNGRVFAYLVPRRKAYRIETYNAENKWTPYLVKSEDDLANVKKIAQAAMERKVK